eukprot:TRINITY_DN28924_c0_g1_i1.p1 TRINITY_DN28924_c0_g1~~TRINITY_DN28924_c0_g1_i1.p1  ORF type:complete len:266 (+),score=58.31 TRINITY_DN28924_c0_g1_i1:68-865(+)
MQSSMGQKCPDEMLMLVFEGLNGHELVCCALVCKNWKKVVYSTPSLWRSAYLELVQVSATVTEKENADVLMIAAEENNKVRKILRHKESVSEKWRVLFGKTVLRHSWNEIVQERRLIANSTGGSTMLLYKFLILVALTSFGMLHLCFHLGVERTGSFSFKGAALQFLLWIAFYGIWTSVFHCFRARSTQSFHRFMISAGCTILMVHAFILIFSLSYKIDISTELVVVPVILVGMFGSLMLIAVMLLCKMRFAPVSFKGAWRVLLD